MTHLLMTIVVLILSIIHYVVIHLMLNNHNLNDS